MLSLVLSSILFAVNNGHCIYYWAKHYSENTYESAQCIKQVSADEYIVAGFTGGIGYTGRTDIWILNLDGLGNINWQKTYNGVGDDEDYPISIQLTADGGYIVAGNTWSYGATLLDTIWILKLDNSGNITWQKSYGGSGFSRDCPTCIQQTSDGGYIVAGYTGSFGVGIHDAWILKLTNSGDVVWQKTYGGIYDDFFHSIIQTADEGYIAVGQTDSFTAYDDYQFWVVKLDNIGNINWQKMYRESDGEITSILQTSDGGYMIVGNTETDEDYGWEDIWILKLDSYGNVGWHKTIGGSRTDITGRSSDAFQETTDGGYIIAGSSDSFGSGDFDSWLIKLDGAGNILWQKTYGAYGTNAVQQTSDGGYVMAGDSYQPYGSVPAFWVLKLDGNGDIPNCSIGANTNASTKIPSISVFNTTATTTETSAIISDTTTSPQNTEIEPFWKCCYTNEDYDCDGVTNNPEELSAGSTSNASFLADWDNCLVTPNGPYLGTCIEGIRGNTCSTNEACGLDGICSMHQEDSYPPEGNGIGDACDCEGNFDCDGDCDGTDAAEFKLDFGRSSFLNPCINEDQCHGDFDCDNDCDGTDAVKFKEDFGRSGFNNPCPVCVVGEWCAYD